MHRFTCLSLVLAAGCLGGSTTPDDDDDSAQPDGGVDQNACQQAMADAPIMPAGWSFRDALPAATRNTWDGSTMPGPDNANYPGGKYRSITADGQGQKHPGCTVDGLQYTAASIPGFACAAREFPFPSGVAEDTTKPIVILVHGNSDSPTGWLGFVHPDPDSLTDFNADTEPRDQLAELLPAHGFRTIAVDLRADKVDDPSSPEGEDTGNTPHNMDHGWSVPLVQELIRKVVDANPGRRVAVLGFSLGATTVRDALRRLWVAWHEGGWSTNPYAAVDRVIVASGANHGVVSFSAQCGNNFTMRGTVTCEMGQRNTYTQTEFHKPLNGPPIDGLDEIGGWWETPCADGDYAFGERGACGGHPVAYTSITMEDLENGSQQDEFVSEHASRLYPTACANNLIDDLNDFDTSGYFFNGFFRNHYGSVRSDAGLAKILAALEQ
jgi:hypothetical protein